MKFSLLSATTFVALSLIAAPLTEAKAQDRRAPRPTTASDRNAARHQRAGSTPSSLAVPNLDICILNEGIGIRTVSVHPDLADKLTTSFPARFALIVGEDLCGNGKDDDCNGQIDDACAPGPEVCGNGIVEGTEACDDGNDLPNDGCYECTVERINPPPAGGLWFAGPACDTCMADQCATEGGACLADGNCELPRRCVGEANCLSPVTGPLGCICGNELSVAECAATTSNFEGDCAEAILGVGMSVPAEGSGTPGSRAVGAFRCMARACRSECAENFYTP